MDPHWESDLVTLTALLENPPEPGSEADLCIDTLWERVMRFWREAPARPRDLIRARLDSLSAQIAAVETRRARALPHWDDWERPRPAAFSM